MNLVSNFPNRYKFTFAAILFLLMACMQSYSQSWIAEAQQDGFILKKVLSDTAVATGQPFSYTIYFTIPAGATNVTITDAIPSSLMFLGHSITSACGTPTVTAPAINAMGGNFSVNWASLPGGCTGSLTISVAFPNGTTCPGTAARNRVCLQGTLSGKNYEFCTPFVTATAIAVNPWGINKYPIGAAWQGGSCQYLTANDTITYQICVYKAVGVTGQLNLVSGIVTDTLPTGAQLVSSTCGATQSGNVITWNVGNQSATGMYNTVCCQFKVYYPISIFPNGSQISNKATLSGGLGGVNPPCSNFTMQSNSVCIEKKSITGASINKWVYTNRQPGCSGQYLIYICNTGTTSITVTAFDTIPSTLSSPAISSQFGLTATITGNNVAISGTLAPGQCGYIYVSFTIPQTAVVGSTITNCVTVNIPGNPAQTACASFVVDTPAPKPCLWKEVCSKQTSYTPGSIFRYRLRIQNIGGLPITGSTLTDVLNPNLEYVGNPSAYTSASWNTPCTATPATPWSGASLSYNSGTNTITALLDTIPATCQDLFYASCGMYGTSGVPFYFIEFDVKVRDTSALGNVPNSFSVAGGSLLTTTNVSNMEYVLVTGVVGYNLEKGVKKPADATYTTSITTSAGSTVNYRLKMNSSGTAALRHVTFADLLPRDNGSADSKILMGCASRGSLFDVSYSSTMSSSPTVFSYWNNAAASLANVNSWTPPGAPGAAFTTGCGSAGSWASGWTAGQKNLAAYFGPTAIGLSGAAIEFAGLVSSAAAASQNSCNSFAVSGWTKHLIQSSIPTFTLAGQLESPTACITIDTATTPVKCIEMIKFGIDCKGLDAAGNQTYTMSLTASSCVPATLLISSPDGSFSTSSFSFTTSPWSFVTTFTHTNAVNPIKIYYTLVCGNKVCRDSVMRDLLQCPHEPPIDECCAKFIHKFEPHSIQSNNSTGVVSMNFAMMAGPLPIKKFSATIVSAQLRKVCFNSTGPWTRIFGDITGGSLAVAPGAGPQLLNIFSREAIWGPGDCIDWTKGAKLKLNMIFPPFSGSFKCFDTLMFKVRYSFTDCECNTCDTLVTYTIVRKWKFLPWDGTLGDLHIGVIRGKVQPGDDVQSQQPPQTSIVMENKTEGDLWIISPDETDNDVIITGVEMRSAEVPVTEVSNLGNMGYVEGDVAFIPVNVAPGSNSAVRFKVINPSNKMQWNVSVRYVYKMDGDEEIYYTEPINYIARVPDAAPDVLGIDLETAPEKVKTFAFYFNNKNGYNQTVSAIELKTTGNMKILAVGPPNSVEGKSYIIPYRQEDGSYKISVPSSGVMGIETLLNIKPVYITLSGVEENSVLEFSTYDMNSDFISTGSVELTNPISKVQGGVSEPHSGIMIKSIVPNPSSGLTTVTFSNESRITGAKFSIVDGLGREVLSLSGSNSVIEQGEHINIIDVSSLTSGMYYITIQTGSTTVSKPLSVVR